MPLITFEPSNRSAEVTAGVDLLVAARRAGVAIDAECGGKGTCGRCIVQILSGEVDAGGSIGPLPREEVEDGLVLACKTLVLDTPVTVRLSSGSATQCGKFTDSLEGLTLIDRDRIPHAEDMVPLASDIHLDVLAPQLADGNSDLGRFVTSVKGATEVDFVDVPLDVVRTLASTLREQDGKITATLAISNVRLRALSCVPGHIEETLYGVAIDIGTTTVAVLLVSLEDGAAVSVHSDYNEQIPCGLDVISRINYARREGGLAELRERVLKTVNRLIGRACDGAEVLRDRIVAASISGNTTMTHLLLGLDPEHIRLEPYTPTVLSAPDSTAQEIGLEIHPLAVVRNAPAVGSYVGGDITAGVLCTDLVGDSEEISLFMDIGTNGELVMGNRDFLMACACSAGPSFEGGGIDCGMRAAEGAIERVTVNHDDGACTVQVIGEIPPMGICGSGMISLIAELFSTGWLDQAGKLTRDSGCPAITVEGRKAFYTLVKAENSGTGKDLLISETDIENIIRSKAAIYSACALMLNQVGIAFEDVSKVYIAGGFGRFIDVERAITIGLLPDVPRDRFHFVGNASLTGTYMTLVSQKHRDLQEQTANRMTYIELNTDPSYMDEYTGALFLPHTKSELFPNIITAYEPESSMWVSDFTRRRKK